VPGEPQHDFFRDQLNRTGDIHVPLLDFFLRPARRPAEQFLKFSVGHRRAALGLGHIFSKWLFAFAHVVSGGFNQTAQDRPSEESSFPIPAFQLTPIYQMASRVSGDGKIS
jgi:hypothetical protein